MRYGYQLTHRHGDTHMTVSRPLSIVLQLAALGMIINAGIDFQSGDAANAATLAVIAVLILVVSRRKAPRSS